MDNSTIKSTAERLRKENWGVFLLTDLLTTVVGSIPLIGIVASSPVKLGRYENYYNALKGEECNWHKLYGKFNKQWESTFLYDILYKLAFVVAFIVLLVACIIVGLIPIIGTIVLILIPIILVIIAVIWFGMEFIGYELLLVNPEMKGNEALSVTFKYIKSHWSDYLLLGVAYIGHFLLVLITCGLYGIKFFPEFNMACVILTDEIINGRMEKQPSMTAQANNQPNNNYNAPNNNYTAPNNNYTAPNNGYNNGFNNVNAGQSAPAQNPAQNAGSFCPSCGTLNAPDAAFCEKCGTRLK